MPRLNGITTAQIKNFVLLGSYVCMYTGITFYMPSALLVQKHNLCQDPATKQIPIKIYIPIESSLSTS